jgi:hypothetical protein
MKIWELVEAAGKNGPHEHFGPILVDKVNDLVF